METSEIDEHPWKRHLPALAPLSEACIRHLFENTKDLHNPPPSFDPHVSFCYIWPYIQRARQLVSYFLVPTMQAESKTHTEKLTMEWFRRHLEIYAGADKKLPAYTSIKEWERKRHLRRLRHNSFEPNSVASIFMMRYLFSSDRCWLPPFQKAGKPWFYVWGLLPGEFIPQIYPYPLPSNLPGNLLLFTQWMGASWQPGWLKVPGLGALAWGKTMDFMGDWYWDISERDMSAWDKAFVSKSSVRTRLKQLTPAFEHLPEQGFPNSPQRYMIQRTHDLARLLLERIGEPILAKYLLHNYQSENPPDEPFRLY